MSTGLLRVLTALVGIPLILGAAYLGGWLFAGLVLVAALISQYELYRMLDAGGLRAHRGAGLVMGALVVLHPLQPDLLALGLVVLLGYLAVATVGGSERHPLRTAAGTVFGVVYPSLLFAFLVHLRSARGPVVDDLDAFYLTLGLFVLVWASDTAAYYVGKSLGRHALAPRISPNKTWEGSFGGAAGAVLAAALLKVTLLDFLPWGHLIVLALICGVLGQLGDLAESRFKRSVEVKDSGEVLPGHGGLLDRFDALLFAVPLYFLYLTYVVRVMG